MSYYGESDRMRALDSPAERIHGLAAPRRPITTRKAGHNARVTVETGASTAQPFHEYSNIEPAIRDNLQAQLDRIRLRKQEQLGRPTVYFAPTARLQRRSSFPIRPTYHSPPLQSSVPPTEPPLDVEYTIDEPFAAEDSDGVLDDLDFNIVAAGKAVRFNEDVAFHMPASGSSELTDKPSQYSKPKFTGQMTELLISSSRWIGNTFERGELGAELGTMPLRSDVDEKQVEPLMSWYHLHRPVMMNFEEFTSASQSILQSFEKEERDIMKLLRDVQKKFEKQRNHGRELESDCVSDIFYDNASGSKTQTESVLFL